MRRQHDAGECKEAFWPLRRTESGREKFRAKTHYECIMPNRLQRPIPKKRVVMNLVLLYIFSVLFYFFCSRVSLETEEGEKTAAEAEFQEELIGWAPCALAQGLPSQIRPNLPIS